MLTLLPSLLSHLKLVQFQNDQTPKHAMYATVPPLSLAAMANNTVLLTKQYKNTESVGSIKLPKLNDSVGNSMTRNGTSIPISGASSMGVM
mmetsp:Transcript_32403/g.54712  ORF Transcript_32403/g.54712 Transcript_32403/m.54712 type:complete len:91 (+) Transcript_32403:480-752(+)